MFHKKEMAVEDLTHHVEIELRVHDRFYNHHLADMMDRFVLSKAFGRDNFARKGLDFLPDVFDLAQEFKFTVEQKRSMPSAEKIKRIFAGLAAQYSNANDDLRRQTKGSEIQRKMGITVAGLGGQIEHQFAPGSHEICM